jgi:hypothetical protein
VHKPIHRTLAFRELVTAFGRNCMLSEDSTSSDPPPSYGEFLDNRMCRSPREFSSTGVFAPGASDAPLRRMAPQGRPAHAGVLPLMFLNCAKVWLEVIECKGSRNWPPCNFSQ